MTHSIKGYFFYYEDNVKKLRPIVGMLIGMLIFIIIYGIKVLNPFYVDWLFTRGDILQHYLGWQFFRRSDWGFPIGMTDRLAYPIQTSVVFTDSIPLFAVFFKVFDKILPESFQYFGIWGILCFGLQGFFSAKIFNLYKLNWTCTLVGNIFLVTSPILIYRMFMHTSLGAQWLILLSIYLLLKHNKDYEKITYTTVCWGILGFIAAGIHLYLYIMCFVFVAGYVIQSIIEKRKLQILFLMPMFSNLAGCVLCLWILGAFASGASYGAWGLGYYSFNLNGFINAQGYSRILSDLPKYNEDTQSEGFSYLGLGMICLVLLLIIKLVLQALIKGVKDIRSQHVVLAIIGLSSIVVAASPMVTFGNKLLIELSLPERIIQMWEVIRATGRFIWIPYYMIMICAIVGVGNIKLNKKREKCISFGTFVVLVCVLIQIYDISDVVVSKHKLFTKDITYSCPDKEIWDAVTEDREFKHLCVSDPNFGIFDYMNIGAIALQYDFTMNGFYFARNIDGVEDNLRYLSHSRPEGDSIYVFKKEQTELMDKCSQDLNYYELKTYVIGVPK